MALTSEQIRKLKAGDPLVVQGKFCQEGDNGNIFVRLCAKVREAPTLEFLSFHPSCVSLPSEIVNSQSSTVNKYDPFRKFRKGDVVRVVERDGRKFSGFPGEFIKAGDVLTVYEDEELLYVNAFTADGRKVAVVWFCLELVSPAEERSPYSVRVYMDQSNTYFDVATSNGFYVARFDEDLHPNAKAAAEAECKRLNEEWQAKACRSEDGKEESNG